MDTGVKGGAAACLMRSISLADPIKTGGSDELGRIMPTRPFAKTGEHLTLLGVGGAHVGRMDDATAQKHIECALENGVRFFDTAYVYQRGRSESLYGKFLTPKYRKNVFIMTKSWARDAAGVEKQVMTSLERMKIEQIDLLLIHSLDSVNDVDNRERDGVFDKMIELKERGVARHLGYSCHTNPKCVLRFMEKTKENDFITACMTVINPVDAAHPDNSFTRDILPKSLERGHSHIAMKTVGGGTLAGGKQPHSPRAPKKFPIPEAISMEENTWFALSLPVTAWVSGTDTTEQLKQNIGIAKAAKALTEDDRAKLVAKVADYYNVPDMETYKTKG